MVKTMPAIIAVPINLEEEIDALRQPKLNVLLLELDRTVLGYLMLDGKSPNGIHEFRFDAHDLKIVGINPGPSLLAHTISLVLLAVIFQTFGLVVPLAEVYHPSRVSMPLAQALTSQIEIFLHVRMEDKRRGHKPLSGDVIGKTRQCVPVVADR